MLRRMFIAASLVGLMVGTYLRIEHRVLPAFPDTDTPHIRGVFHVHSEASHDSELSLETIAAHAKALGLQFVVVTDHNSQLASSIVIDEVTIISSAELTTPFGHLIQLGAADLLPKSQRSELSIHNSIRALGGIPILAHPGDTKRPWEGPLVDAGGLEIASLESSTRRRAGVTFLGLLPAVAAWRLRPELALAQLYDRDTSALKRWDGETDPRFAGFCAAGAHGKFDVSLSLRAWHIVIEENVDAPESSTLPDAIIDLMSAGRFHCVAAVFGPRPRFDFFAVLQNGGRMYAGDTIEVSDVDELVIEGPHPPGLLPMIVLLRNGEEVVRRRSDELIYRNPSPGAYRVEIRIGVPGVLFGAKQIPVIYSNKIRLIETLFAPVPDR